MSNGESSPTTKQTFVAGKLEQLLGKIQRHYGITRDEAEKQISLRFKNL